ncbi:hypothetical protein OG462_44285 [Streptomyces sp. NBC_01077]|uniref:hypothetical protein n=1 Tax=Streptomyces sp. NBC_01077 TaxID=2903746 RepID=UPI00386300D6|nr:hypothetical protein OG462_00720 [Streptomyces sp. NBC_01077]WSV43730.1 hypothetical protein OG462_44285 [Streptomyces sp. NBC_01077]
MSVYTPQQISQPQTQQPYDQPISPQQPWSLQAPGQQPWAQQGHGQFSMQGMQQLPLMVTELSLRCSATALSAVVEQLRTDPQILMGIQAQGHIPPHAFSQVLTECARRIAPIVHTALTQLTNQSQQGQMGRFPGQGQSGQFPGMQPQAQLGQLQGQSLFGLQPQYGQTPGMGM